MVAECIGPRPMLSSASNDKGYRPARPMPERGSSMSAAKITAGPVSDLEHRTQLRRAVIASTVGTTIEYFDFLLYGQMAAIIFAKLYFPFSEPLTGTLQAFATFAVGFVARPIGAAIFGHYGDRIG